jgi:hypothetical protein
MHGNDSTITDRNVGMLGNRGPDPLSQCHFSRHFKVKISTDLMHSLWASI